MADTRVLSRKATDLLKRDHREVKQLFKEYEKVTGDAPDEKSSYFEEIRAKLSVHGRIEEEIFYPAVEEGGGDEGRKLVDEARGDHELITNLLEEIAELDLDDDQFDAKMTSLRETVEHHVEVEEEEIFPIASKLGKEKGEELASELARRKAELSGEEDEL